MAAARRLILNNDDLGMYRAINVAVIRSIEEGVASSCSLMVPCPAASHAMRLLHERPELPFGVHLTLLCDTQNYGWGPLTPRERVRSLVTADGRLFDCDETETLMAQARLDEVELEFRAQLEVVRRAGLEPTHLDWHCLHDGGRPDIFDLSVELAREHGLAVRVAGHGAREKLRAAGLPAADHDMVDSYDVDVEGKSATYARMLRELPAGLSEWAVHSGLDEDEARAIDEGWEVRWTDYQFLISPEARELIRAERIEVIDYRPFQEAWKALC
jgi:predicted glycoside hydrolase/deacetylase ChbG (UPF0249 family)